MKVRASVRRILRQVQDRPPPWGRAGDLRKPEAQAAAGVTPRDDLSQRNSVPVRRLAGPDDTNRERLTDGQNCGR